MTSAFTIPDKILVAIGGNATHPKDIEGTSGEQKAIAANTAQALLPLALLDKQLVITHGNGPVVGKILMRQTLTRDRIAPMPLDICVAHSQGGIAYLLVQAIENALREAGSSRHAACLLTQVEVAQDDPSFQNPTKPIGAFYSEEEAGKDRNRTGLAHERGCWARLAPRRPFADAETHLRHFPCAGSRPPRYDRSCGWRRRHSCGSRIKWCAHGRAGGHRQGSHVGPHGQCPRN